MSTVMEIGQLTRLELGYKGEAGSRDILVDMTPWLERWPEGAIAVEVRRPEPDNTFYLAATSVENGILTWDVTAADVAVEGRGKAQIILYDEESGDIYKSRQVQTIIRESIDETLPEDVPDPMETWVAHAAVEADRATTARQAAEAAAASAEAAKSAAETAVSSALEDIEEGKEQAVAAIETGKKQAVEAIEAAADDALGGITAAAPAIICEAVNAVATVTDAAAMDALHVVSEIEADVSGTPDYTAGTLATITSRSAVSLYHGEAYDESATPVLSADLPEAIYGGTLDWVTGVLTVTHAVRNLTAANWTASSNAANRYLLAMQTASLDACTHFPISAWIAYDNVIIRNSQNQVVVNCSSIATLADWKAYLSAQSAAGTPVKVVYGLPEDQRYTIQLDPQTVTMLKGSNALWSDTGYTDVAYVADTKMYIDGRQGTAATYADAEGVGF